MLLIAMSIISYVLLMDSSFKLNDFLINISVELIGIVLTILVIDYLMVLQNNNNLAKKIALEFIHELFYIIWVWQGGQRVLEFAEYISLTASINPNDMISKSTKKLLFKIGAKASFTLQCNFNLLKVSKYKYLKETLEELSSFKDILLATKDDVKQVEYIKKVLLNSTYLGHYLKLLQPNDKIIIKKYNPSNPENIQDERYTSS